MGKTGRAEPYHHGDLRAALLCAAHELVELNGPEALSFRAVARAAGVSQTAPYNHFDSKEALLATVAQGAFDALAGSQEAIRSITAAPREAIIGMAVDYVGFAIRNPQRYRLMFGGFFKDWDVYPLAKASKGRTFEPLKSALAAYPWKKKQGRKQDIELAAIAVWSLVHGISMLRIDGSLHFGADDDPAIGMLASRAVELFLQGLD